MNDEAVNDEDASSADAPESLESESSAVELPPGTDMSESRALKIVQADPTPIVLLAGPRGSGKTTLLASIYERFHRGALAGYIFSGSQTLVGFEDRCFLARVASGAHEATTQRTELGAGTTFYHLCVRDENDLEQERKNILFADMSGEHFRSARLNAEDCRELSILKRADCIALLVDGERIVSPDTREVCLREARQLTRRCIEEGMFGMHTRVYVIYTKWDTVLAGGHIEAVQPYLDAFESEIRNQAEDKTTVIGFYRVAASPKMDASLGLGFGLDHLMTDWIATFDPDRVPPIDPALGQKKARREFDRFLASNE